MLSQVNILYVVLVNLACPTQGKTEHKQVSVTSECLGVLFGYISSCKKTSIGDYYFLHFWLNVLTPQFMSQQHIDPGAYHYLIILNQPSKQANFPESSV